MIKPGATLGMLGSGQLGRMFTQVATTWGYNIVCYSPEKDTPTGKVGAHEWTGEYIDTSQMEQFLNKIDALTFEFENIPNQTLNFIQYYMENHNLICRPSPKSISIAQNRTTEKNFFREQGLPTTNFFSIRSFSDYKKIQDKIEYPIVLKKNTFGYDGKGQYKFINRESLENFLKTIDGIDFVIETFVEFEKEVSVIVARFQDGTIFCYDPVENIHKNHILDITMNPATISQVAYDSCIKYARTLVESLGYVGVLCLEFFVRGDMILCNEFAPRPHNSGHFTIDAANVSQFELQLRTLCDIPLTEKLKVKRSSMKNLMGEDILENLDTIHKLYKDPNYKIHIYQKNTPKKGRKMGHINYVGDYPAAFAFRHFDLEEDR